VTERDDASTGFDHDVVARQPGPSRGDPATLSERVSDRRDAAVRRVVGLGIEGGDNGAGRRCQYGSSEAGEQRGGLGPQERRDGDRGGASEVVDGNEVDRVGRGEQGRAVTGHVIGGAVLRQPASLEGIAQIGAHRHDSSLFPEHEPRYRAQQPVLGGESVDTADLGSDCLRESRTTRPKFGARLA